MKNKFDIAKNIKEHEKKYTIALVILFVFQFLLSFSFNIGMKYAENGIRLV